jgi:hypothetical protein
LQPHRRPPGRSYSRHTPRLERLNHSADRSRAPVTTPAAQVLPGLAAIFIQPVTSLEGIAPSGCRSYVHRSHGGIVSASNSLGISAGRNKKHPPTLRPAPFAVRHRLRLYLTGKPLGAFRG